MNIHTEIKKDKKEERIYQIEVNIPKSSTPMVPGEAANQDVGVVMKYFEDVILGHNWIEDMGDEEKVEVLRQYALYWFLGNVVQIDMYPLPEDGAEKSGESKSCQSCGE